MSGLQDIEVVPGGGRRSRCSDPTTRSSTRAATAAVRGAAAGVERDPAGAGGPAVYMVVHALADELLGAAAVLREARHAGRGGERDGPVVGLHRELLHGAEHAGEHGVRLLVGRLGHDQQELVGAVAADQVAAAQLRRERRRPVPEHFVAGLAAGRRR